MGLSPPPQCTPLTVTSKSTALPTWLSRRTALSPRTVPPKKSRGGTATLRGQRGQCSPVGLGGGEGLQPPPHFHSPRHREGQLNDHTRPGHHRLQGWLLADPGDNKGVGVGGITEPLNPPQCGSRGQGELHCQVCGLQGDAQSAEDKVEADLGGTG